MAIDNVYNHPGDSFRKTLEHKIRREVDSFRENPETLRAYFRHPKFEGGIGKVFRRVGIMMNALGDDPKALAAIRCKYEDRHNKK